MVNIRIFSRPWSGAGTERARSFYFVIGRCFIAVAIGKRRLGRPLHKDTDDGQ